MLAAALFFSTYEMSKLVGAKFLHVQHESFIHMAAASCAEIVSILIDS